MAWPSPYNGIPSYTPMPPNCIGFPYHPSGVNVHYPLAPSCGGMYHLVIHLWSTNLYQFHFYSQQPVCIRHP